MNETTTAGDGFVVPAGSPFNVRFTNGMPGHFFGAVISPVDLATPWPGLEHGQWLSTSITELPGAPVALTLHEVVLDPGESRGFSAADGLLMISPFGPEMTFASTAGTAEILYVVDLEEEPTPPTLLYGKKAAATPGAEFAQDDVAGIFLPASSSGTVWNNGTDAVSVVVLTVKPADPVTGTPRAD